MSCILYYSNFCEPSKKLVQNLSKLQASKDVHFICIDNRERDANGKTNIILTNGQKMILPQNITQVPSLLLLHENYKVICGSEILTYISNKREMPAIKQATNNNMEPSAFQDGFGALSADSGVSSDSFSFLDQSDTDLGVSGNGGVRQMHNYVTLADSMTTTMTLPEEGSDGGRSNKIRDGDVTMEGLQKRRDEEMRGLGFAK